MLSRFELLSPSSRSELAQAMRLADCGLETIAGFAWDRCADRLLLLIGKALEECHE